MHVADLEGHTDYAKREVLVLAMPGCRGVWAFESIGRLLKPSSPDSELLYYMPFQQNFPGVDAIMYPPLLLFQYSVNGQRSLDKDEPLLNMLCTLVKKYDLDSGAAKQRTPFFFVVPNNFLLSFRLHKLSTIASFLAKPACVGVCSSKVLVVPEPKREKREFIESDSDASGSRQEDTRCWYCRCLKYFHFHVMGIPGFLQQPKEQYILKKGVFTIDPQGAFQEACQAATDTSVNAVSKQLGSVAIRSDHLPEDMSISDEDPSAV